MSLVFKTCCYAEDTWSELVSHASVIDSQANLRNKVDKNFPKTTPTQVPPPLYVNRMKAKVIGVSPRFAFRFNVQLNTFISTAVKVA